jgi:hypothetical protein
VQGPGSNREPHDYYSIQTSKNEEDDRHLEVAAAGCRQREGPLDEVRAAVEVHLGAAEVGDAAGHGGVGGRAERVSYGLADRRRGVGGAGRVRAVVRHVVHPRARGSLRRPSTPGQTDVAVQFRLPKGRKEKKKKQALPVNLRLAPTVCGGHGCTSSCKATGVWRGAGSGGWRGTGPGAGDGETGRQCRTKFGLTKMQAGVVLLRSRT